MFCTQNYLCIISLYTGSFFVWIQTEKHTCATLKEVRYSNLKNEITVAHLTLVLDGMNYATLLATSNKGMFYEKTAYYGTHHRACRGGIRLRIGERTA